VIRSIINVDAACLHSFDASVCTSRVTILPPNRSPRNLIAGWPLPTESCKSHLVDIPAWIKAGGSVAGWFQRGWHWLKRRATQKH
jgi:hypothetical protein